jgi:hypothetical protein
MSHPLCQRAGMKMMLSLEVDGAVLPGTPFGAGTARPIAAIPGGRCQSSPLARFYPVAGQNGKDQLNTIKHG